MQRGQQKRIPAFTVSQRSYHLMRVFWLPKYCPTLNPIERLWRHLKDLACANKLDQSLENLAERVAKVLSCQNSLDHILKCLFYRTMFYSLIAWWRFSRV
jgi:hypothetical protein